MAQLQGAAPTFGVSTYEDTKQMENGLSLWDLWDWTEGVERGSIWSWFWGWVRRTWAKSVGIDWGGLA
jgi:hypothetical protein